MQHKTSELIGALLDAAVAKAEELVRGRWDYAKDRVEPNERSMELWKADGSVVYEQRGRPAASRADAYWEPSVCWAQAGPIIERERISLDANPDSDPTQPWTANGWYGPTPLVAAMRAYVASKFGDTVEL